MGGTSGISTVLSSGDTSIQTCSILVGVVSSGQRNVRALEAAASLPEQSSLTRSSHPMGRSLSGSRSATNGSPGSKDSLTGADLIFVDPDNGVEPTGYSHGSAKAGKSVLLTELHELATPGRCLIMYHHQSRRKGGHHCEIVYCAERLRAAGFATVDALRAKPYSPRVYFLLNAPFDVQRRAKQIAVDWQGWITWHADAVLREGEVLGISSRTDLDAQR